MAYGSSRSSHRRCATKVKCPYDIGRESWVWGRAVLAEDEKENHVKHVVGSLAFNAFSCLRRRRTPPRRIIVVVELIFSKEYVCWSVVLLVATLLLAPLLRLLGVASRRGTAPPARWVLCC